MTPSLSGPHVVNQVFTAPTGWGYAARCGCGWKTAHSTENGAVEAGQGHYLSEHTESGVSEIPDEWMLF
jgi:hypothetical protein